VHIGRLLDWPFSTYAIYVVHMMVAVPMLVLEVPFAKWAHLAYRPLVLYLLKVKEEYFQEQATNEVEATAGDVEAESAAAAE